MFLSITVHLRTILPSSSVPPFSSTDGIAQKKLQLALMSTLSKFSVTFTLNTLLRKRIIILRCVHATICSSQSNRETAVSLVPSGRDLRHAAGTRTSHNVHTSSHTTHEVYHYRTRDTTQLDHRLSSTS